MLVIEIKNIPLTQDLNLNSNTTRHIMFSQRRESTATSAIDDEDDIHMSVRVRQFVLQKVIIPFVKELRQGDPSNSEVSNKDTTYDCIQSLFYLDSDMIVLTLLKCGEVAEKMINEGINVDWCQWIARAM